MFSKRLLAKWILSLAGLRIVPKLLKKRHIIMTFHRVYPLGDVPSRYDSCPSISVDVFRALLRYLQERFQIVTLEQYSWDIDSHRPMAAVTFDDGWRDNYSVAYPVLLELGIPATVFVSTAKIGSSELFWQQRLGAVFQRVADGTLQPTVLDDLLRDLGRGILRANLGRLYQATVQRCKQIDNVSFTDFLARLRLLETPGGTERQFLSAEEIVEMAKGGVSFGSHADSHDVLTLLPPARVEEELSTSKRKLERILGAEVSMLSYPYGSTSEAIIATAKACGYRLACGTRKGRVTKSSQRFDLPRIEWAWHDLADEHGRFSRDICELMFLIQS